MQVGRQSILLLDSKRVEGVLVIIKLYGFVESSLGINYMEFSWDATHTVGVKL